MQNKEQYNRVVHDSLIEKGYIPLESSIWTYYLREVFKKTLGLTWFNKQWWCPDATTHHKMQLIIAEIDATLTKHLSAEQLHQLHQLFPPS